MTRESLKSNLLFSLCLSFSAELNHATWKKKQATIFNIEKHWLVRLFDFLVLVVSGAGNGKSNEREKIRGSRPQCLSCLPFISAQCFSFYWQSSPMFFPQCWSWLAGWHIATSYYCPASIWKPIWGGVPLKPHFLTAPVIPRVYCLICNQVD